MPNKERYLMSEQTTKKRRLKKGKLFRFIFCIISLIFFLFCCIFYGIRLVKYYKIYNPKNEAGEKVELLSTYVTQKNPVVFEGDGLYRVNGIYMFKGTNVNNYITFSNMLWRIVKINGDNSIDIVLEDPINNLMWNKNLTDYTKSDVHKYLNDVFLKVLDQDKLKKTTICTDIVADISKITCNTTDEESYVKLLNITDFVNSKNKKTFINDDGSLWLSDRSKTKAWYAKGTSISSYDPSESYPIKPVVTLKMDNTRMSGEGTKEDPYTISKPQKELKAGTYVKLGDHPWIVYEVGKENMKLILPDLYGTTKYKFDTSSNLFTTTKAGSLAKYLNTTFYSSLPYKDQLVEDSWYIGAYTTSYKDIYKKEVKAKVGLYNVADLKFVMMEDSYFLLTPDSAGTVYTYGPYMTPSKVSNTKRMRPAIAIKKSKIKSGDGTAQSPFVLEG